MTKDEKMVWWSRQIEEQQASDESVASWCRTKSIPAWKFYYWRRRLESSMGPTGCDSVDDFIRLDAGGSGSDCCGLELSCGDLKLRFLRKDFDEQALRRLLPLLADWQKC